MEGNKYRQKIEETVAYVKNKTSQIPEVGLVLGSGLGIMAEEIEDAAVLPFAEIPNFPISTVKGHAGELVIGKLSGKPVAALSGRIHYYEGYTMKEVCFPLEIMSSLGIKKLIVTNAGGAVNENFSPGDIVIIRDHINFIGSNPLIGAAEFIDMTQAYSKKLRKMAWLTAESLGINIAHGVYLANSGPMYETPAEVRMARILGADIVGMSTVPEVIVARRNGIEVLGLSMITNVAAGLGNGTSLSHEDVIATTKSSQGKFKHLVTEIIKKI